MRSLWIYLVLLISLAAIAIPPTSSSGTTIGITYTTPRFISGSVLVSPDKIAEKVVSMKIPSVRLLDSNPAMIRAFADTDVSLLLSVPNPLVPPLASNRSLAKRWVNRHVLRFGNDAAPDVSPFLLEAMENVHRSLIDLRIYNISVSTTLSFFNIVPTAFHLCPSEARFLQPNGDVIIRPILEFLDTTNSSFLISFYPYNIHRSSCSVSIELALFDESPWSFVDDLTSGVRYYNLWDMMVDAVISSMAAMGHENLPVVVAETGWDSSGIDAGQVDATTFLNSQVFLKALLAHLRSGISHVSQVYITDLDLASLLRNHKDPRFSTESHILDSLNSLIDPTINVFSSLYLVLAMIFIGLLEPRLPSLAQLKNLFKLYTKLVPVIQTLAAFYKVFITLAAVCKTLLQWFNQIRRQ